MIKLFSSTDTLFSTNGDKVIIPLRAKVHKEDNGSFYLDLDADLSYVNDLTANRIIVANTPQGEQAFRITNVANTMAGFKTWLGTNNPKVLLEAATPTYNKITYEPLLEQLEAFYRAKSQEGQTNISQENNDLPFEIEASALEG